jgi:hypothetical protein
MSHLETTAIKSFRTLKIIEMKVIALERVVKKSNPEIYKLYVEEFDKVKAECADDIKEIERIIKNF